MTFFTSIPLVFFTLTDPTSSSANPTWAMKTSVEHTAKKTASAFCTSSASTLTPSCASSASIAGFPVLTGIVRARRARRVAVCRARATPDSRA